jgi:integrase
MARVKFTEKMIGRLEGPDPSGKKAFYWDTEQRGLGLVISGTTATKSWVVQSDARAKTKRIAFADANLLSLAEARQRARRMLLDMHDGVDPRAGRSRSPTLRQTLEDYLKNNRSLSERSRAGYRTFVGAYLRKWLDRPLREITREDVERRHAEIASEVSERGRGSGGATANSAMRGLRVLYNFALERDASMPANPVRLRRQWFSVPRRTRSVVNGDLPVFYRAVMELENPVARDYLLLLLFTGLRRAEAARLTWADVDLVTKVIRIPGSSTKSGRKLDLPITESVLEIFKRREAEGRERFVFAADSRSGHIEEPRHPLDIIAERTGIRISAHDLRRTYVTAASETPGVSELQIKMLVNHALPRDVTAGYIVASVESLREPAERVACGIAKRCVSEGGLV